VGGVVLCAAQLIYRVSGEASLAGGRSLAQADWRPRWSPADCAVAGADRRPLVGFTGWGGARWVGPGPVHRTWLAGTMRGGLRRPDNGPVHAGAGAGAGGGRPCGKPCQVLGLAA